jgi:myo-inositol 2-dehydrogenase / D-chiro-inositol 1-dehydrogenase
MSSPALRLGIVGCGFATESRHLPALARLSEVEVVALADLEAAVLARVAEDWRIARRYSDPQALIGDPQVEAVAICTPAADHVPLALAALAAGRHVFVEKPLALSLAEADRLVAAASASASKVLVGFNLRWHRLVLRARELVASGAIGRVRAVRSVFADPLLARPGVPEWRRRRDEGGGSILDKAIHHFDLWRYLLADEVEWVTAASASGAGDDEIATMTAHTARGTLLTAWSADVTTIGNEMTLDGETGTLHLDLYRFDGLERRSPGALPGAPARRLRRLATSLAALAGNAGEVLRGGAFDTAYDRQWRHFAAVVRGDLAPGCGLDDGRAALAIALAALRAAETGGRCAVAPPPPTSRKDGARREDEPAR